jgi:SPOR domain
VRVAERTLAEVATSMVEFLMRSFALKRSLTTSSEAANSPAPPPDNPLDEFAGLMGIEVSTLERFDGAGEPVLISGPPREPAVSEIESSRRHHENETSVHGSTVLPEGPQPADLDRSAETAFVEAPPTPRRPRALALGVLTAVGVVGCLGAWALEGAPRLSRTSTMETDVPLEAASAQREVAVLRDDSTSIPPENQTDKLGLAGKLGPVNLSPIEKRPSVPESPVTTPSATETPIATAALASAAPAPTAASEPAAPPVMRSIALQGASSEPAQVPVLTVAPQTAPKAEPKRMKTVPAQSDGSVLPSGDGTPASASHAPARSVSRTSPAPGDPKTPLVKPPKPVVRPPVDASAGGSLKPAKERLDAPAELSANSADTQRVARIDAIAPAAPPPADNSADRTEGDFSAKSVLQFLPNLYEKAAGALGSSPPERPAPIISSAAPPPPIVPPATGAVNFSAESVLQFVPNLYERATGVLGSSTPAAQSAGANPNPVAASQGGAYGVQIAAPTTEPAARRASVRLRSRFAPELGGLRPTVRQTEVNGRKLYQVGIGGMSKADAEALCLKLRTSGGEAACSVASN